MVKICMNHLKKQENLKKLSELKVYQQVILSQGFLKTGITFLLTLLKEVLNMNKSD